MQELLAKSYLTADHDRCYAVLLQFHETAFETLEHTIPPKQNTLSELHAAVIRLLTVQKSIFPQAFAASTIRHEKHLLYRARRYEFIKLQLQQKPSDCDIPLQNLKTTQLLNIGKKGYRFPEKHIWLIKNSESYYDMWKSTSVHVGYMIAEFHTSLPSIILILNTGILLWKAKSRFGWLIKKQVNLFHYYYID